MSKVADRMIDVTERVEKLRSFNSEIFHAIYTLYGDSGEEFKMILEIRNKIDNLLKYLNDEPLLDLLKKGESHVKSN